MRLSHRARKRLAILVLVAGLPVYVVLAVNLIGRFERPSPLVELGVYAGLGVLWALPLRSLFRGLARPDPEAGEGGR